MDIVARLKQFIDYLNIPVTQFADLCKIPRPTLSQLLNRRNKKISNELLLKLHDEYPQLNVLWLLYGEGKMLSDDYPIHKIQNSIDFIEKDNLSDVENKDYLPEVKSNYQDSNKEENFIDKKSSTNNMLSEDNFKDFIKEKKMDSSSESNKKIVNIIIYYNDNSFESFVPDGKGIH